MPERRRWWIPVVVAALAVAAYWPALHGGWIWDDDAYVTENVVVQSADGWLDAWIPGRTPQWYPLVFVSFWMQHALWGLDPFPYHAANLLLHLGSSLLLWRLLRRLGVPGAGIAAALFALHPMQVESVAWVTERKNVLSMFFALSSVLAWLRAGEAPRMRAGWWCASFGLFLLAMLSKTTAVAVPVALVATDLWLRRGGLRRTTAWTAPFFVVGVAMGLVTAWVEATHVGATGAEFQRSAVERLQGASMAWWFYLRTWCLPNDLIFIYPRFDLGPGGAWAWLALAGAVALLAVAARAWRRGARGPMLLLALYTAGVFPALGFINVYPLRYAPVADHFAYVGSVAMAVAAGWAAQALWTRLRARGVPALGGAAAAGAVALALAALVNAQTRLYEDAENLWRRTLISNPQAWIAANNLTHFVMQRVKAAGQDGDRAALEAELAEADRLVQIALFSGGDIDLPMMVNLSEVRRLQGRLPEALEAIDSAIALQPDFAGTHWRRGRILELMARIEDAAREYARAAELDPGNPVFVPDHARLLRARGQTAQARDAVAGLVRARPRDPEALTLLASLQEETGDLAGARTSLERVLTASTAGSPAAIVAAVQLAGVCLRTPQDAAATTLAAELLQRVVSASGGREPFALTLLARALAMAGDPARARTALAAADALPAPAEPQGRAALATERAAAIQAIEAAAAAAAAAPGAPAPPEPPAPPAPPR
ncbi:MAG: tetratricopeptide repeat protein [Phycisphaerales bacterium]